MEKFSKKLAVRDFENNILKTKQGSRQVVASELQGKEEAAFMRVLRPTWPLQRVIYTCTDGSCKMIKCCN